MGSLIFDSVVTPACHAFCHNSAGTAYEVQKKKPIRGDCKAYSHQISSLKSVKKKYRREDKIALL